MRTTFKLFFLCLFCLSLALVSGCGGSGGSSAESAPKLTSAEQVEVDKYVQEHGRRALAEYLKDVDSNTDEELALKYAKYFVSQGADVNAKTAYGGSLLGVEAERGNLNIVKFLVSKGADVNAKDNFGKTPLDRAKETMANPATVEYLSGVK